MNKEVIKQQIIDACYARHATKVFDPEKKISREDMEFILEVARLSPSSIGSEPWRFVVIESQEVKEKLKTIGWGAGRQLDTASHWVVLLAKKNAIYDSEIVLSALRKRGLTEEQFAQSVARYETFQKEDIKVLESERAIFDWACKQTYIALGNMMSAAAMIGIDSCPIEGFHYESANQILAEAGILNLEEEGISCMLGLGYRGREPREKTRKNPEEVITWVY